MKKTLLILAASCVTAQAQVISMADLLNDGSADIVIAGTTYTVNLSNFALLDPSGTTDSGTISEMTNFDGANDTTPTTFELTITGTSSFTGEFRVGGVQLATELWTLTSDGALAQTSSEGNFDAVTGVYSNNSVGDETASFSVTGASSLFLESDGLGGGRSQFLGAFEITSVVAAIPEPSSTALLGLGGLALLIRRKR